MNPKVDWYFNKDTKWQNGLKKLRTIMLATGLGEELKWGHPCYTLNAAHIALIHEFKDYFALLFMKGALLKDPEEILIQQTENVQSARQIRFSSANQIDDMEVTIRAYIQDAIEVEQAGLEVEFKKTTEFAMPDEFRHKLEEMPALKDAFESLTPGRQRAYLLYFSAAKQSKTRQARVEKYLDQILDGLGLDD